MRTVHGLWIGQRLSPLELLSIRSFLDNGHPYVLWAYDRLETPLPQGAELRDAAEILPREAVFAYRHANEWGHGKGSYAGFSDIFRYRLLYLHGGWWADLDIVCLRSLDEEAPYVFRDHDVLPVVGNLMCCPPGSALMAACYERASRAVNADNRDWFLPIRILNEEIQRLGLSGFRRPGLTNRDRWDEVSRLMDPFLGKKFFSKKKDPAFAQKIHRLLGGRQEGAAEHLSALNLMNEEWRSRGLDKNRTVAGSALHALYRRFGLEGSVKKESPCAPAVLAGYAWRRAVRPLLRWTRNKTVGTLRRLLKNG